MERVDLPKYTRRELFGRFLPDSYENQNVAVPKEDLILNPKPTSSFVFGLIGVLVAGEVASTQIRYSIGISRHQALRLLISYITAGGFSGGLLGYKFGETLDFKP